jgi:crotonobetainyl-CoA:carnitine CoA-transferase CaiB-like acyl-CoA transferase
MDGDVLAGVRVADFGRYVAGPWCAALLGDLGADVVRVERVDGGEDRFVGPVAGDEGGAIFVQVNRGKRSLALDPSTPGGREVVARLLAWADVVVANLPPKVRAALGIDWDDVRGANPRAILVTATTFGEGPYGDRFGFDGIAQAMSGAVHLSGPPGHPTKSYVPWVDYSTAHLLAFATLAALLARQSSGVGQHVDGALLRTAVTTASNPIVEHAALGLDRQASGNRGQTSGPYDLVATADGHVQVMVIGRRQFAAWCGLVGAPELLDDPRFADDRSRGEHGGVLSERLAAWCAGRTTAEVVAAFEGAGLPAGPVLAPADVIADHHVREAGFFVPLDYPGALAPIPVTQFPVSLSATPGRVRGRAPRCGEHTADVLAELGFDDAEAARLRASGVVA